MIKRLFKTRQGLDAFLRTLKAPSVAQLTILHEEGCTPSRCVCVADRQWTEVMVDDGSMAFADAVVESVRAEKRWRRETSS